MSDTQPDPSWWQASDGKWYPPQESSTPPPPPSPGGAPPAFGGGQQPFAGPPGGYGGSGLPSVNGQAVASMVLGIVALVFCWCWFVSGPCALVGLPLGGVALSRIKNGQADPRPKNMAVAGLVMNIIAIALIVIILIWAASVDTSSDFNFD